MWSYAKESSSSLCGALATFACAKAQEALCLLLLQKRSAEGARRTPQREHCCSGNFCLCSYLYSYKNKNNNKRESCSFLRRECARQKKKETSKKNKNIITRYLQWE
jgi:hypothetical protein